MTVSGHALTPRLQDVSYSVLPGNAIRVNLNFSGTAPVPVSFTTDNPARIVVDLPGIHAVTRRTVNVGVGNVSEVKTVEGNGRTRVVVNLLQSGPFVIDRQDNRVMVSVGIADNRTPSSPQRTTMHTTDQNVVHPVPVMQTNTFRIESAIQGIDFRRSPGGAAQIITTLTKASTAIDMEERGRSIILTFKDVHLPEKFDRQLDVSDFATPVMTIDTTRKNGDVVMQIVTAGEYEHLAYQADNVYTLEIKQVVPKPAEEEIAIADKQYTGERLSLIFQDIDLHAVLHLLAEFKEKNLVMTDQVQGTVTLRLKNVPWDQALDIILDSKNLGIREIGNVWHIDLKSNIQARRKQELESKKTIQELEPLKTEFIQVNYATAEEFSSLLKSRSTADDQGHSFLSARGSVAVNSRTNTLLIQDTAEKIDEIRQLVRSLDKPVRQVLISSRVVVADDSFSRDLGVRFGQDTNASFGNRKDWGIVTGGVIEGEILQGAGTNMLFSLPAAAANAGIGLAVGKIGTYLLQLELTALENEGRGEVISSPRVITADQQPASIEQGIEIAVAGVPAANQAATVEYKKAVLSLQVTPRITPDDRVLMKLSVTKDTPSGENVNTRSVNTQVLVNNGETVVLGGVFEQTENRRIDRVPFFGELPVVGALFRRTSKQLSKSELLIFVTPKILKELTS
jgi:type IV pilus assembly protein PilQ